MKKKNEEMPVAEAVKEKAEEIAEAKKEETEAADTARISAKRQRKIDNREAKAARKEKNKVAEKKKRPSNVLLCVLIFGVLFGMFAFIWGYNYSQKEKSIQSYIKHNGGKEAYSNIDLGDGSVLSVTAKKNDMKVVLDITTKDEKAKKKYYDKKEGKGWIKYIAAYYLSTIKPETRAFFATAECIVNINGKEYYKTTIKYRDCEDILADYTEMMGGGE